MASPAPTPERTQEETRAWIAARVRLGHTPTYAEISAWSGRAPSTVGRWVKAWVRDGCDPRVSDGCAGAEMGERTHPDLHDADGDEADWTGEAEISGTQPGAGGAGIRDLSVQQQRAVELLAGGKRTGEVAEAIGVRPETVSRWLALPKVAAVLLRVREENHQAAKALLRHNGQEATLLLLKAMQEAAALLSQELAAEDKVKVLNAAARLSKIAMEHGGYPKTERVELGGEVGLQGRAFEGEGDEEVEEGIERLQAELVLLEGGAGAEPEEAEDG